jgi:hypothetical protein
MQPEFIVFADLDCGFVVVVVVVVVVFLLYSQL